ncbi:hypothetical protein PAEPH01_2049 [Pancytospora epiphaga]|nr:hypothetical protein PAEPH01_2049 [Pancytospora epiphaga]
MESSPEIIHGRIKYIDEILSRLENKQAPTLLGFLRDEIEQLRTVSTQFQSAKESKKVMRMEEKCGKKRYYLADGSVYVVKEHEYRYLYDACTKVVTYEFSNGQIERTFESGLKEIRRKDGSIVIKGGSGDYFQIN